MTQDELAKLLKTSISVIGRYERDEMTPSVEMAKKIANALDVSLDYLIGSTSVLVKDKKKRKLSLTVVDHIFSIISNPKEKRRCDQKK